MIALRTIEKADLIRAAEINDALASEHGRDDIAVQRIGEELGIDIDGAASLGADHALTCLTHLNRATSELRRTQRMARMDITHAYTMGVLTGLRAVAIIGR